MRVGRFALVLVLGACGCGDKTTDGGIDAASEAGDATPPQTVCNFTVEGAEKTSGSCQVGMVYYFGLLPDALSISSDDAGTTQGFQAVLPRDGGFAPGTFVATDFAPLSQAVTYGSNGTRYVADVGPYATSSVTLQLSSVDPYPVDKNLYGHLLPSPLTHGTLQAVLVGGPFVENDAGVVIPQDASVTLTASF